MTTTRRQAKDHGPIKVVSEPDPQDDLNNHLESPKPEDNSNATMSPLDDVYDLWARQEHFNDKTNNTLDQLSKARQELYQTTQEMNGKIDMLSATLESFMHEMRQNKKQSINGHQESSKSTSYVPPYQRINNRNDNTPVHFNDPIPHGPTRLPSILPSPFLLQHTTIKLEFPVYSGDETVIEWID